MNAKSRDAYNRDEGVLISSVKRNSKAWEGGLRAGLIIVGAIRQGKRIEIDDMGDFNKFIKSLEANESVLFRIMYSDGSAGFAAIKAPEE